MFEILKESTTNLRMTYRDMDQFYRFLLKFSIVKKFSFSVIFLIKKEVTIHIPFLPSYIKK